MLFAMRTTATLQVVLLTSGKAGSAAFSILVVIADIVTAVPVHEVASVNLSLKLGNSQSDQ